MKMRLLPLLALACVCLLTPHARAATPTFSSFAPSDFYTNSNPTIIHISTNLPIGGVTNLTVYSNLVVFSNSTMIGELTIYTNVYVTNGGNIYISTNLVTTVADLTWTNDYALRPAPTIHYSYVELSNIFNYGWRAAYSNPVTLTNGTNVVDSDLHEGLIISGATATASDSIVQLRAPVFQGAQLVISSPATANLFTLPAGSAVVGGGLAILNGDFIGGTNQVLSLNFDGYNWKEVGRYTSGGPPPVVGTNYWTNNGTLTTLVPGIGASVDLGASVVPAWSPDFSDGFVVVHDQAQAESHTTYLLAEAIDNAASRTNMSKFQVSVTSDPVPFAGLTLAAIADTTNTQFEVLLQPDGLASITLNSQGTREFEVSDGSIYLTNQIQFNSTTNVLYRDANTLVYSNGLTGNFMVRSGAHTLEMTASAGVAQLSSSEPLLITGEGTATLDLAISDFSPISARIPLGAITRQWGPLTIGGFDDGGGVNYSQVRFSHTGTNGDALFTSQSGGTAGAPRPFAFTNAPVKLTQGSSSRGLPSCWFDDYKGAPGVYYISNIVVGPLASGVVDVFTPPAGLTATLVTYSGTSTNLTSQSTLVLLKQGGNYYKLVNTLTVNTNTTIAGSPSQFTFSDTQTFAISNSVTGLNLVSSFLVYQSASSFKTASLCPVPAGNTTIYTVPANTVTTGIHTLAAEGIPNVQYSNTSGAARQIKVYYVPNSSSATAASWQVNKQVADGSVSSVVLPTVLMAGDTIVINSDGAGVNECAWMTYVELTN